MTEEELAAALDGSLTNPLLRGLDIAHVRFVPADGTWWSRHVVRRIELYARPGAFGTDRLEYWDPAQIATVERAAARFAGAHEARLLPAGGVSYRPAEMLIEGGYSVAALGSLLGAASPPPWCALALACGAAAVATGRWLCRTEGAFSRATRAT